MNLLGVNVKRSLVEPARSSDPGPDILRLLVMSSNVQTHYIDI